MNPDIKPFIRLGLALTTFWIFAASCISYVQYEIAAQEVVAPATLSIAIPDRETWRVTKINWLFDHYIRDERLKWNEETTRLALGRGLLTNEEAKNLAQKDSITDEELMRLAQYEEVRSLSQKRELTDEEAIRLSRYGEAEKLAQKHLLNDEEVVKQFDLIRELAVTGRTMNVLGLNAAKLSVLVFLPIIAMWFFGVLAIWVMYGFKSEIIAENPLPLSTQRHKEPFATQAEDSSVSESPLPLTQDNDSRSSGVAVVRGKESVSWGMYLLHAWGGICLKVAGDMGRIKGAAIVVVLLVGGFYLSKLIVVRINALEIEPRLRRTLILGLVPSYFLLAGSLGWLIGLLH